MVSYNYVLCTCQVRFLALMCHLQLTCLFPKVFQLFDINQDLIISFQGFRANSVQVIIIADLLSNPKLRFHSGCRLSRHTH